MTSLFEDVRSIVYCHSFDLDIHFAEDAIFYHRLIENPPDNYYKLRVYEWVKDGISICTTKEGNWEVSEDSTISINLVLHLIHKLSKKPCEHCSIGGLEDHSDYENFRLIF